MGTRLAGQPFSAPSSVAADPNGTVAGSLGQLVWSVATGQLMRNTDGGTTWEAVVAGPRFLSDTWYDVGQLTASQNNWAPTGISDAAGLIVDANSGAVTITGITGGTEGRLLLLQWKLGGTSSFTLTHNSVSSSAANRIRCPGNTTYAVTTSALLVYTSGLWHVVAK